MHEWVYQNIERATGQTSPKKVVGKDTVGDQGHARWGMPWAQQQCWLGPGPRTCQWKMTKFSKVQRKVTQYMDKAAIGRRA
jgi:hypothetical protein